MDRDRMIQNAPLRVIALHLWQLASAALFGAAICRKDLVMLLLAGFGMAYPLIVFPAAVFKLFRLRFLPIVLLLCATSEAAVRSTNFVVSSAPAYEQPLAQAAERFRKELAIDWLGEELPDWTQPCRVTADVVDLGRGNGGATSFVFHQGQVFDFEMAIQGDTQELVESVLQHEVLHTVFASYFREALPRWADEGACGTVESNREQLKQHRFLVKFLQTGRGIAFGDMFRMKDYPRDILPLYAQGHSLSRFLIMHGGKRYFVDFLAVGLRNQNWPGAVAECYGYENLDQLQASWQSWLIAGSPHSPKELRLRAPDT